MLIDLFFIHIHINVGVNFMVCINYSVNHRVQIAFIYQLRVIEYEIMYHCLYT